MAADKATVTGKTGPGLTVTSLVLNDVKGINFQFDSKVVSIYYGEPRKTFELDYDSTATVTFSITAGVSTVTIST